MWICAYACVTFPKSAVQVAFFKFADTILVILFKCSRLWFVLSSFLHISCRWHMTTQSSYFLGLDGLLKMYCTHRGESLITTVCGLTTKLIQSFHRCCEKSSRSIFCTRHHTRRPSTRRISSSIGLCRYPLIWFEKFWDWPFWNVIFGAPAGEYKILRPFCVHNFMKRQF